MFANNLNRVLLMWSNLKASIANSHRLFGFYRSLRDKERDAPHCASPQSGQRSRTKSLRRLRLARSAMICTVRMNVNKRSIWAMQVSLRVNYTARHSRTCLCETVNKRLNTNKHGTMQALCLAKKGLGTRIGDDALAFWVSYESERFPHSFSNCHEVTVLNLCRPGLTLIEKLLRKTRIQSSRKLITTALQMKLARVHLHLKFREATTSTFAINPNLFKMRVLNRKLV